MKKFFDTTYLERVKLKLLLLYVFFLPLSDWSPIKLNSIILIVTGIIWLYQCFKEPVEKNYYPSAEFLIPTGIFFIQFLSFFHGGTSSYIEFNLTVKLPFLILPLVFTKNLFSHLVIKKMQDLFIAGCIIGCLVSFRFIFISECRDADWLNCTHYEEYLVLHRPYFGMYLLIAILFLTEKLKQGFQIFPMLLIIGFLLFLFLIQAKMSLLILLPLMLVEGWFAVNRLVKRFTLFFSIALFILVSAVLSMFYFSNKHQADSLSVQSRFFVLSVNTRLIHFDCGKGIVEQNPWFGAGAGNVSRLLDDCYQTQSAYMSQFKGRFNAHNELLEETARHGILGLSVYLICYFFFFKRAIQARDKIYLQILLIAVLASLTESVFSRSQGVMLISFFLFLYFVKNSKRPLQVV